MPPRVIRRRRSFASAYLSGLGLLSSCLFLGTLFSGHLYYLNLAKQPYDAMPLPFPPAGINYQAFSAEIEASPALRGRHIKVRHQQKGGDSNINTKALTTGDVSYSTTSIDKDKDDASTPAVRGGGMKKQQKKKKQYMAFVPLMGLKTTDRGSLEVERLTFMAWESLARYTASLEEKHAQAGDGGVELHVVGLVEDIAHCDPAIFGSSSSSSSFSSSSFSRESENEKKNVISCVALDHACRSSQQHSFGDIPTVDCILSTAHALGEEMGADVYIMANGDVVFTPTLVEALGFAYKSFGAASPGFAMVGRRIDLNVTMPEGPDDDPLTEESLLKEFNKARLHPVTGVDYFAFTRNVFPRAFPPYLIGRWKWDNALLLQFLLSGVATVDGSDVVHALHLGMKSFKAKEHMARTGAKYNEALAEATVGKGSMLGRIDFTEYKLIEDLTMRNVSMNITTLETSVSVQGKEILEKEEQEREREQPQQQQPHKRAEHVLALERRVHPLVEGQIAAMRMVAGSAAAAAGGGGSVTISTPQHKNNNETDAILLLPVRVGEKTLALEWACWACQANVKKYMLLVADENEALELEAELLLVEKKAKAPAGVVIYMDPRSTQIRNGGGRSKQYYEHKKTGQASPPVLAYMMASFVSRLLQLDLAVVMVPVLVASPPWEEEATRVLVSRLKMSSVAAATAATTTEEKEKEKEEEEGKKHANANATTNCHLALWRDTDKAQEEEGNLYVRIRPSSAARDEWSHTTLKCFEDDARHYSLKGIMDHSRCLPTPSPACHAAFETEPASHTGAPEPVVSRSEWSWWWNLSTGQCLQGSLNMNAPPPGEGQMEGVAVARQRELGEKEI